MGAHTTASTNTNVVEFEGWTGDVDYGPFIDNVWERNLPTKFLQQSPIMTWEQEEDGGEISFENGTVASSPLASIDGRTIPTNREITYDGATVYTQGTYLLPWSDTQGDRLYHYNPDGGATTWTLTDSYAGQPALTAYRLTDTGRADAVEVPVTDGQVTLTAEEGTAYVLFPQGEVPEAKAPQWGQGSGINDPGFFSGGLDHWGSQGEVSVELSARQNFAAHLAPGAEAAIWQELGGTGEAAGPSLEAGTYSLWAWVEIEPGKEREVTVQASGEGVTAVGSTHGANSTASATISSSTARNSTASDEKLHTYYQRVRVTFTTTGGPVEFRVAAAEGDAAVLVDDVRIVPVEVPVDPAPTPETILFEDFETTDTGYWPFVTGSGNAGGDARTQLAERHEPYSQSGWWGRDSSGAVVEGGKLIDNVIEGTWSLLAHEENNGLILRTTSASVPLEPGHRHRVSFDYQSGFDTYSFVTGTDTLKGDSVTEQEVARTLIPAAHDTETFSHEFTADDCGSPWWIGVAKHGGGYQADLAIDGLRVEDLGPDASNPACSEVTIEPVGSFVAGEATDVEMVFTSSETTTVEDVSHTLTAPEGWTVELAEAGETTVAPGQTSTGTWSVTPPEDAASGVLEVSVDYQREGETVNVGATREVSVLGHGEQYLSDLRDQVVGTPTNGWGPVEWDMSNGENGAGDGTTITIAGQTYDKGIGAHANSRIVFDLGGRCTSFISDVGVDDEIGDRGTVTFTVRGDGDVVVPQTPVHTGTGGASTLEADITGVTQLELIVGNADDDNGGDHADWAAARVTCGVDTEPEPVLIDRVSGVDRYDTAAKIAAEFGQSDVVYLANGADFPDALSGTSPAVRDGAPVLLTKPGQLPAATRSALSALGPEQVFVLGGSGVVQEEVLDQVTDLTGADVTRLSGVDRYGTAAAVALGRFDAADVDVVYVAAGREFADALSGGPLAGAEGAPILLTGPDRLPRATTAALESLEPAQIVVLGGAGAIPDTLLTELGQYAESVDRVAGEDRYATAALVADRIGPSEAAFVASGQNYPDALAGAAWAGSEGSVLLLTKQDQLPQVTGEALVERGPSTVTLFGGLGAVADGVRTAIEELLGQ